MEITGLSLNIIGTIMLFRYGFPQPNFEESVGIALEDNTPIGGGMTAREYGEKIKRKKRLYKRASLFALTLVLIGFILQFIGTII